MKFLKASALMALLLVCAVLMLGVLSLSIQPVRGARTTEINGDVNCDDKLDISDAIAILQWKFMGGPAPCAIAESASVIEKLDVLGSQITALQESVGALRATWPPRPEDLVNLVALTPNVNPHQELTVYTVPNDRVLIITSIKANISAGLSLLLNKKPVIFDAYNSASGLPVPPGSDVTFRNNTENNSTPVAYLITGYLRNP